MPYRPAQTPSKKGKVPPPEDTFEEAAYLKALGEKQKPVTVKLVDGEVVRGWVEYYDKNMIRLTRDGAPNLFIFKHEIKYIAEETGAKRPRVEGARAVGKAIPPQPRVSAEAAGDGGPGEPPTTPDVD